MNSRPSVPRKKSPDEAPPCLDEATPAELERWLGIYAHKTNKAKLDAANSKEAYHMAVDNQDILLAHLTLATIQGTEKKLSKTMAEAMVLDSKEWRDFMTSLAVLRHTANLTKIEADNLERSWDTIRSIMSSRNAERRMS